MVNRPQLMDGFQLDNQLVAHQEIYARLGDPNSFVHDRKNRLPPKRDRAYRQLDSERLFVDMLEKAGPN